MRPYMLPTVMGVALLSLLTFGARHASADTFDLTSCHVTGATCENNISALRFGTVTLTTAGTGVNVDIVLEHGDRFVETGAGAGELFLFNATSGMTVSNLSATFNSTDVTSTLGGLKYVFTAGGVHADGTGDFTGSIECMVSANCNGGSIVTTVNDLHFTVNNATLAQLETTNATGNYFAADIQCGTTQTGCANGLTGPVDASVPPTVPDGGMTLMLLGSALACIESLRRRVRA